MESPLAKWESFYVIVGSSAGALTGLQFAPEVSGVVFKFGDPVDSPAALAVPEPGIVALLSIALLALGWRSSVSGGRNKGARLHW